MRDVKKFSVGDAVIAPDSCPHCSTKHPSFEMLWSSQVPISGALTPIDSVGRFWGCYNCTTCGNVVLAIGQNIASASDYDAYKDIVGILPKAKVAADELPETVRKYLQQAFDSLHAPDAAGLLSAAAIDAMLKDKGFIEGNLYARIDKAVEQRLLTKDMAEWAHKVRLESNNVRHADTNSPHLNQVEAKSVTEFAEALGDFLYVFTARVQRGIGNVKR